MSVLLITEYDTILVFDEYSIMRYFFAKTPHGLSAECFVSLPVIEIQFLSEFFQDCIFDF